MRALIYDGKAPRVEARRSDPTPAAGEVVIRPLRMGVCATDLELCKGYMGFTGVLGHEFVGIVEAAAASKRAGRSSAPDSASNAKKWVGKRVVGSINCVCGKCDMCKAGLREHCRDRTVLGIAGRDGCFADRFVLPAVNLFEVPDHVDDDHAVFTEPLAAAYQILRQLTIEGRPYITVLGDGRLGLLCAQVMSQLNATVRCVGRHLEKLQLCEKWGVKHRLLEDVGLRQDQDIVVDCTGSAGGLTTAMSMVRPRGTIVVKTTVAPERGQGVKRARGQGATGQGKDHLAPGPLDALASLDLSPIVINELNVIGSRCGPFPDALEALSAQKVDVVSLISRRMKLADGVEALKTAGRSDVLKVLLEP